jgi:hypothetical protein
MAPPWKENYAGTEAQDTEDMAWSDVAISAVTSLPKSAKQFGSDIIQPVLHPIETAKTLYSLGAGIIQKFIPGEQPEEAIANAVGKFFIDRYGSIEGIKRTIATDPVGIMADLATVLTGGGLAAARAPGVVGKVGRVAKKAGLAIDPLMVAAKAVKKTGQAVPYVVGGLLTHTGPRPLQDAYQAVKAGSQKARGLYESMRGQRAFNEVVDDTRSALETMRQERAAAYQSGMVDITSDTAILDFGKVDDAIRDVADVGIYEGKAIYPSAEKTWTQIADSIDEWRMGDPDKFHTPVGLDNLKKRIGGIRSETAFGSPDRVIANAVYRSLRDLIAKHAPAYGKTMKDYERASSLIDEIERTLSLGEKASADTALRKLQSIMKDNVSSNLGQRGKLVNELDRLSGGIIRPQLAGQSLRSWLPRGLGKLQAGLTATGGVANPAMLGLLPFQSPRLMGEVAALGGKMARPFGLLGKRLEPYLPSRNASQVLAQDVYQAGRLQENDPRRRAGLLGY